MIETLLAVLPWRAWAFFYRMSAWAALDLVIQQGDGERWAIEIMRGLKARPSRGFHTACADIDASRAFVGHAGEDRLPVSATREGTGGCKLAEELRG